MFSHTRLLQREGSCIIVIMAILHVHVTVKVISKTYVTDILSHFFCFHKLWSIMRKIVIMFRLLSIFRVFNLLNKPLGKVEQANTKRYESD